MPNVIDVAKYIIRISLDSSEEGEYDLTPMKLQKLIYFCQGFHLAFFDSPLFDEDIQAWVHGPVCPSLYHRFRKFESNPVILIDADTASLADREKHLIDDVYRLYGQYTAAKLRNMTHDEGPWKESRLNAVISKKRLKRYFDSVITPQKTLPPLTEAEKEEVRSILLKAESDGEIDLSQFCE